MKEKKFCIAQNLGALRQARKYSQEWVAERIGVSRQAVAKWESGETIPDLINCDALAELYQVSVSDLIYYDQDKEKISIPPKGKYVFGAVKVGERGQVVLPKKARDVLHIKAGDLLIVLGDDNPESGGLALVHGDTLLQAASLIQAAQRMAEEENEEKETL